MMTVDEEIKKEKHISEPDENGVRYFDLNKNDSGRNNNHKGLWNNGGNGSWENNKESKKWRFWKNISVLFMIMLIVAVIGVACSGATSGNVGVASTSREISNQHSPYIATMYVEGTIQADNADYLGRAIGYQHDWTMNTIDELIKDSNNEGIIMFVDSPGGTIYESDELYLKLCQYKEQTNNPVYAVMGTMAASGGYYISAPCDKIFANRNTWTGSIGVTVGTIMDFSEFLANYGIKSKTITSGEHKAMGSNLQAMTPEEEAIWRSLVNEAYDQFVEIVADGRGLPIDKVKNIADGRIYSAKQAMNIGLVDEIGTMDDAYSDMIETYELGYCNLVDVKYEESSNLGWLLALLDLPSKNVNSDASMLVELAKSQSGYPASYMCEALQR